VDGNEAGVWILLGVQGIGREGKDEKAHRSVDMDFEGNSLLDRKAFDLW
jgi:hypothetical protein